jgi:replicative DNA helicase
MNFDEEFSELLILKTMMKNKDYLTILTSPFESKYFANPNIGKIFKFSKEYIEKYRTIPSKDIIISNFNDDGDLESIKDIIRESESIDFDEVTDWDYLIDATNNYLKNQAIKNAIIESVDIIDNNGELEAIRKKVEDAISKDLKMDLGLLYFYTVNERLKRIYEKSTIKIPTGFYNLDEYINGGFPPFTLSVFAAKIHAGKSNLMANMAARQVMMCHNVAIMTLEMSEEAFAQRFDSIYSLMDINRIYDENKFNNFKRSWVKNIIEKKNQTQEQYKKKRINEEIKKGNENWINELLQTDDKLKILLELVDKDNSINESRKVNIKRGRGELYIKQFPTGEATIRDFKIYIRELIFRGIELDIIYVDYINLMKSTIKENSGNLYTSVKKISEELRALSFEFAIPVVSVSQLNREGSFAGFEDLSFNYIAESMGLPATADFMAILGTNDDEMVYENEIWYKIVKNRFGRPGVCDKLYMDARSLKMYDVTEEDIWLNDATSSDDERNLFDREDSN